MIVWQPPYKTAENSPYTYLAGRTPVGDIVVKCRVYDGATLYWVESPSWMSEKLKKKITDLESMKSWCEETYADVLESAVNLGKTKG